MTDHTNNTLRKTMIIVIVLCCICMFSLAGALIYVYQTASNNIYVVDKGGAIVSAFKKDLQGEKKAEIDNHVRMIYNIFFTYDPNNVKSQTTKALPLMGEQGRLLNQTFINSGWYDNAIQNNLISEAFVDSIKIDVNREPYQFQSFGKQKIRRFNKIEIRALNLSGSLVNVSRVIEKNPHGLQANFKITDNRTIGIDSLTTSN